MATAALEASAVRSNRIWTIPNVICGARFFGSLGLLPVAYWGNETAFVILAALLFFSDWIDGKLAIWLDQRSVLGARIDSVADATFYAASGLGVIWLKWSELGSIAIWMGVAIGSYVLTSSAGYFKYGRIPSYHTYGAKATNWIILGGLVLWFVWDLVWPIRIAFVCVTLTNLEATYMTSILPQWIADVPSFWHAQKLRAGIPVS